MAGRSFVARPDREKSLVLGYLRFPEITEIFQNIAKDLPLSTSVLSEWDRETLDGHIRQFIIPLLLEAGAVRADSERRCGYSTEFEELCFEDLTRSQLAVITAKRAALIGSTIQNSDSRDEALSGNFFFHALPEQATIEMFKDIRSCLGRYMETKDNATEGRQVRLAIVARAERSK